MATKEKSIRWNWTWFDWAIFLSIAVVFILMTGRGLGFKAAFVIGAIVGILYHFTLRILWRYALPGLFEIYVCSVCQRAVPVEATKCPNCGAEFESKLEKGGIARRKEKEVKT